MLSLRHYIGETNTDVSLSVSNIAAGVWHHAAVSFTRTNTTAGVVRLYVDGAPAGSGAVPLFNLPQTVPIVFGGHNRTNSHPERWFSGWLDDLAVFTVALSDPEIARLATRTVGHNAGLTSTNLVALTVRDINDPPMAGPGAASTAKNQTVDIDLRNFASDIETPPALLRFTVSGAVNGTVTLLADGHTARFVPATNFNDGFASFTFTVTDMGVDSRAVLHYSFEPPDVSSDALTTDNTGNGRDGSLQTVAGGSYAYVTNVPPALAMYDSASLQVNESNGTGGADLARILTPGELDLSDHDWSVAGWFRRATQTNDDFIFYIGNGDGFGSNEELQLYGVSGSTQVGLRHFIGENLTDVNLYGSGVALGNWLHVAATFTRTNTGTGVMRFYANGALIGTAYPQFNLDQSEPVVFGGHNNPTFAINRWFNGQLDDLALFNAALSSNEIARLATGTVGHFGGLSATNIVTVKVGAPNVPPILYPISNRTIIAGQTLAVTATATDQSIPPQRLFFNLSAPSGAIINSSNGLVTWRPTMAQAGGSNLFTVVVSQAGWVTNLAPVADAYVRDGSLATNNYGSDTVIAVRLAGAGFVRESFLKFSLTNIPGAITDARLQLWPTLAAVSATHAVALVTNDAWTELTLTWSNKPASGPLLAAWQPQAGLTTDIPLATTAQQALADDKLLSLRIYATNAASDRVEYASREGDPAATPRLAITSTNGASLTATQTFWVSVLPAAKPTLVTPQWRASLFSLSISGDPGPDYTIQATTNLANPLSWASLLTTNPPSLPVFWTDTNANNFPARYYRVLLGP
jgi:hypothetical protein